MKAVILAAGQGSRLRPARPGVPKCLVEVAGRPLIEHQLSVIHDYGIGDVVVVIGYKGKLIQQHLGDRVRYRSTAAWDSSNNFHTLWTVRDELRNGFACFFADVFCDAAPIGEALRSPADIRVIVDCARVLEGTMRVRMAEGRLTGIGSHIPVSEGSGNFIGIAVFSAQGARLLLDEMEQIAATSRNEYYTIAVDRLARRGEHVACIDVAGRPWVEIDTVDDLERSHALLGAARQTS